MYKNRLNVLFFIAFSFFSFQKTFSQCFEIESILVNACATGANEGFNEMVRFKIGPVAQNSNNLVVTWPNNSWLGVVQNIATATKVATLNADIAAAGGCRRLIEPPGGVIPANASVILVTSYLLDTALNSFGALTSDIYIIFQNNGTVIAGHFGNGGTGIRTLIMTFGGTCSDTVSYAPSLLTTGTGGTGGDGATVLYTPSGTETYVNNGCVAPVPLFTVDAGTAQSVCTGATVALTGSVQGQQSVAWSAPSGSFSTSNATTTNYTVGAGITGAVVLTLSATNTCGVVITDTLTLNVAAAVTPTFTAITPICSGTSLSALPITSNNSVTGTWTPALNNTATTSYAFTPTAGQCAATATMTITVNPIPAAPTGATAQTLCSSPAPTIASLTATGTAIQWYTAATGGSLVASSTALVDGNTYYASQTVNGCESITRLEVTVDFNDPQITTSATTICIGETVNLAVNYTNTTLCNMNITPNNIPLGNSIPGFTYGGTFNGHYYYVYNTPTSWTGGELICRQNGGYLVCINDINENTFISNLTNNNIWIGMFRDPTTCQFRWLDCMNITFINWRPGEPNSDPCGEPYVQIIRGCSFGLNTWNNLNDNSSNGACYSNMVPIMEIDPFYYNPTSVSLLWSTGETTPTINPIPTTTTTYWCDVTVNGVTCRKSVTITVNPNITPTFTQVAAICSGTTLSALPTTSNNSVTGTWSPALNNLATTTYTFAPASGQCAVSAPLTIVVNPKITPTFTAVASICSGTTLSALPTTSTNSIPGTWSPALNNLATTTYTFAPASGQCAVSTPLTIVVSSNITPTFTAVAPICSGTTLSALPTTSNNSISGTWSPALNNLATTTYTFAPASGQCAVNTTLTVTVQSVIDFTISGACEGNDFVLKLAAVGAAFSPTTAFTWQNSTNTTVGTNDLSFNVSTYINLSSLSLPLPQLFHATVTDSNGCFTTKPFTVTSLYCAIQKGISPNGDGDNEFLDLHLLDVKALSIFNRYGMKVYSKSNYRDEWHGETNEGKQLPDGTYYYVIELNSNPEVKTGWIYINR
jgi:gliding motility-associated-like protein